MKLLEKISNYLIKDNTRAYFGEECYKFKNNFDKSMIEKFENILKEKYPKIYTKEEIMMLGSITAFCPYCNKPLPKFPSQKTKCKNCNNYYYKRSRLRDGKEVVVTKEERDFIDIELKKYNSFNPYAFQEFIEDTIEKYDIRNDLIKNGLENPTEVDVFEYYVQKQEKKFLRKKYKGEYFPDYLKLGELQLKNKYYEKAFTNFSIALFLCINGPSNSDTQSPFTPKLGIVPDGLLSLLLISCKNIYKTNDEIKLKFIEINEITFKKYNPPLTPNEAWDIVNKKLER